MQTAMKRTVFLHNCEKHTILHLDLHHIPILKIMSMVKGNFTHSLTNRILRETLKGQI